MALLKLQNKVLGQKPTKQTKNSISHSREERVDSGMVLGKPTVEDLRSPGILKALSSCILKSQHCF